MITSAEIMYMKCGWVLGLWGIFFFLTFCTFLYFLNFVPFSLEKLYATEKYCICFSPLQWSPPGSNSFRHPAHPLPWLRFSLSTDVCVLCTAAFGFKYLAESVVGAWIYLCGFSLPHQTAFSPEYLPCNCAQWFGSSLSQVPTNWGHCN